MKYGSIIHKSHIANHCPNVPPHLIRKYQKVFEKKADNSKKRKFSNQISLYDYHDTDKPLPQGRIDKINRALLKFFICCRISFRMVESPFFIDFINELNVAYDHSSRDLLANCLFEDKLGDINSKICKELQISDNLMLEYIYQLFNLSSDSHTGEYIAEKIEDVINRVEVSKFSAIVSNNGSNVQKVHELIEKKFSNIMNVRCMSYYINLMSCDIVQHLFTDKLLKKVNILAIFFRNNARASAKFRELLNTMNIKGDVIVPYCKTRWMTAYKSIDDVLKVKVILENVN
ncbi:ribonuclease H-like domain-containing protein [Rhizophagus irregularis DAOM 181602=DAOM 197198]|nr:ribonuclease H-like domain-containing protein [Rhizophagus irregularis DAOM 181602=DAOM 197198]